MANKKPVDWFIKANPYRTHVSTVDVNLNLKAFNLKLPLIIIENENIKKLINFGSKINFEFFYLVAVGLSPVF